ncbi:PAS domain-containing protein [Thalassobaculum sp. OXR-137]|uniref:PAS domain-containing protein n=1 Tax=Thalassobaculum sp. OXR-137 TaxID=3100173 RepID=UPI002AC9E16F|nr:PAS domain-containing protein [Thalassobaculum sp. OXR-137]WPZ33552.1 PAS domain-containing protein [Thalassobaculum sp. OXR-137]
MVVTYVRPLPRNISDGSGSADGPKPGRWDWTVALVSPMLQGLLRTWRAKCREDALPARRDFDPLDMRDALGWLFVVQADPDIDDFRYTLIGTEITEQVGRDNTGRHVGEVFGQAGLELYREVRDTRQPVRVWGVVDWLDKEHKSYETLVLPLADDGHTVDRFIGAMVFGSSR